MNGNSAHSGEAKLDAPGRNAAASPAAAPLNTKAIQRGATSPWQRFGWLMSIVWLGFLYYPAESILESAAPNWAVMLGWVALVMFAGSYVCGFVLGMREGWHRPSRTVKTLFFLAVLCAALTVPAIGWGATSFLPFLMAYASYVLGVVWHWVVAGIALALGLASVMAALLTNAESEFVLLAIIVMMCAVNSLTVWLISRSITADELRLDLATSEERESIARDVHDLIGHSLTVVKLKAELAMRLIEKDPAAARNELEEIARLTSEAIAGVRGTVTGLRSEGLAAQLRASRAALESAGVTVTVAGDPAALSPAQSLSAAWILREATTNVLRHARATRVRVSFEPGTVTIEDDGVGAKGRTGNGVRGMTERASAAGATLRIGEGSSSGTVVSLTW